MIMITGATGFLGAQLLYDLVSKGHRVKALYRNREKIGNVEKVFRYYSKDISAIWDHIEWIQGDLLDYYSLMEHLKGVKEVYHTAGLVSFHSRDKENLFRVNIQGTANLVNACLELDIKRLCHVSSIATLSEPDGSVPVGEDVIWNPDNTASVYAISKLRGEMEVWRGIEEGLQAVIVNPSVIIGPGMWNGSGNQILYIIYRGLKYFPEGSSGYVDVRDVTSAMIKLIEGNHFGERFIVSAENISHRSFIDQVSDAMQKPRPRVRITPLLSRTALIGETIRSFLTGMSPRINRKTLDIAAETAAYSNNKITDTLGMNFITVEESVKFSIPLFLTEVSSIN